MRRRNPRTGEGGHQMTPWTLGLELLRSEPEKLIQYPMYVQKRDAKRKPKHAYTAPLSIRLIVVFRKLKVRGPISSAELRSIFYDDLKWWSQEQTHRFMAKMSLGPNPFSSRPTTRSTRRGRTLGSFSSATPRTSGTSIRRSWWKKPSPRCYFPKVNKIIEGGGHYF